jgi:threonine/homoserine/homoserine lactone efflux protein
MLIFTLSVLGLLGLPGPTNTLLATAGTLMGVRKAVRLIPAELAGYLLAIAIITLAIRPIIGAHPEVAKTLRLVASAILVVLAVRLWRSQVTAVGAIRPWQVFVTTLFNPKALVFALSVIPHLIDGDFALAAPYLVAFSVMVVAVASAWASFGGLLSRRSLDPRSIRRVSAVVLCVFAAIISSSVVWPR